MYAILIDKETNRILSATFEKYAKKSYVENEEVIEVLLENYVLVETLPEGDISDYLYVNGEFIYSPIPKPEEPENENITLDEIVNAVAQGVNSIE